MGIRTSSRRSFVKLLAAAPLLSQIAARELYAHAATAIGKDPRQNVYSRLGVKTVINCRGTWTYLSGSLEFPEVRQAQVEAAQHFVNMLELQRAVGRRLSELTGAESGFITSGAAGAMAAATAACMARADDKYIWQLPDTTGLKHEVIMVGGRSAFDSAIRLTGAKLVLTFSPEELINAISENTAMIYTTDLGEKLQRELAIAKEHKIPMLLDDAAGIPPADNSKLYAKMGIDLYCFSGGKGLCGPQCSGLLLGRKDLIEAALLNSSPREGAVCRPMKVGKEEVIGCLTALETWLSLDENKLYAEWNGRVDRIRKLVETVPGVRTDIFIPQDGNRYPTLRVYWDQAAWRYSVFDCVQELRAVVPAQASASANRFYSPGVDAGDYVYISGQGARRPDGSSPANFSAQVRQALDNVKAMVEAAGLNMDHVVYTQVYLENISKYAEMNAVFSGYFGKTPPARAVLGVARVPEPPIQISAVAVRDLAGRRAIHPPNYRSDDAASAGILTHDRLFVSSMAGSDPANGKVPEDPAAQVDLALDKMQAIVKAAGLELSNMVFVNPYLTSEIPML